MRLMFYKSMLVFVSAIELVLDCTYTFVAWRLVVSRNAEYDPSSDFLNEHKDFVDYVKKAFKQVEDFYGVDIPTEEMIHIYNYVKNN